MGKFILPKAKCLHKDRGVNKRAILFHRQDDAKCAFTRFPSNVSILLSLIYVLSVCIYLVTLDLRHSHTSDASYFKTPVSWELWSFDTLSALFYPFFCFHRSRTD